MPEGLQPAARPRQQRWERCRIPGAQGRRARGEGERAGGGGGGRGSESASRRDSIGPPASGNIEGRCANSSAARRGWGGNGAAEETRGARLTGPGCSDGQTARPSTQVVVNRARGSRTARFGNRMAGALRAAVERVSSGWGSAG